MATLRFDSWLTRGLMLLVGTVLLIVSGSEFYRDSRFANEARTARGTILSKEITTSTSHRRGSGLSSRTQHYEAAYRFAVDGRTFDGRDELSEDHWKEIKQGDIIDVLYLPTDPASNRLVGRTGRMSNVILALIGLILTATGILTSMRALRSPTAPAVL